MRTNMVYDAPNPRPLVTHLPAVVRIDPLGNVVPKPAETPSPTVYEYDMSSFLGLAAAPLGQRSTIPDTARVEADEPILLMSPADPTK